MISLSMDIVPDNLIVPLNPIWVQDPRSGKQVNVGPFLEALNAFESEPGAPLSRGCVEAIQRIVRMLCLTVHDPVVNPPQELASIYFDLYRFWDLFAATGAIAPEQADT